MQTYVLKILEAFALLAMVLAIGLDICLMTKKPNLAKGKAAATILEELNETRSLYVTLALCQLYHNRGWMIII